MSALFSRQRILSLWLPRLPTDRLARLRVPSRDDKPAVRAMLHAPEAVSFDHDENLYISDTMNHRVRKVDGKTGLIATVAGNGDSGYEDKNIGGCGAARFVAKESAGMLKHGDGLLATEAVVNSPVGLAMDSQGHLYICERGENKIRRLKLV